MHLNLKHESQFLNGLYLSRRMTCPSSCSRLVVAFCLLKTSIDRQLSKPCLEFRDKSLSASPLEGSKTGVLVPEEAKVAAKQTVFHLELNFTYCEDSSQRSHRLLRHSQRLPLCQSVPCSRHDLKEAW